MLTAPLTGDENLDSFLYDLANQVDSGGSGTGITVVNGALIAPDGTITGYVERFMHVKYADDPIGTGITDTVTSKAYYGFNNSSLSTESTNPTDYTWKLVAGGFGTTNFLYYKCTGNRNIQWAVNNVAPGYDWQIVPSGSIDLDILSSTAVNSIPSFISSFSPATFAIPYSGSAYTFAGVTPTLTGTNNGIAVQFSAAQTDAAQASNTWRIGNSSTTGYTDITATNITIGSPSVSGLFALWPAPTAVANVNSSMVVPIRYKDILGNMFQCANTGIAFTVVTNGTNGTNATAAPAIDISGYTSFSQNAGGANTPSSTTISALTVNITSPTYSWSVTGATPTTGTGISITISPNTSTTSVSVTLTVNGTGLGSPLVRTWNMPVVYSGAAGSAGSNGVMSAYPSIYQWTATSTPPTRPSTTSTYTWSTGAYIPPSGWSATSPSNTTPGSYLWEITVPVNVVATVTTSLLDWTNTSFPINAIAYNGANGANGSNGSNGSNGATGPAGSTGQAGSASYSISRTANNSGSPTESPTGSGLYPEVLAVIGRQPVNGDICNIQYNTSASTSGVSYRFIAGAWSLFNTYIPGSLIVQNTITADRMSVSNFSAASGNILNITGGELTITDITRGTPTISGTTMTGAGTHLYSDGRFALGDSTRNIVNNGSVVSISGFLSPTTNSIFTSTSGSSFPTSQCTVTPTSSATITLNSNKFLLNAHGYTDIYWNGTVERFIQNVVEVIAYDNTKGSYVYLSGFYTSPLAIVSYINVFITPNQASNVKLPFSFNTLGYSFGGTPTYSDGTAVIWAGHNFSFGIRTVTKCLAVGSTTLFSELYAAPVSQGYINVLDFAI
jgi:hypothetical protein